MSRINMTATAPYNYELASIECIRAVDPRTGNRVMIRGPFFTPAQLATILGMNERSLYPWTTKGTKDGHLRTVLVTDRRLASASMVYEFLMNSHGRIRDKLPIFEKYMRKYHEARLLEHTHMSAIETYTPEGYKPRKVVIRRKKEDTYE